MNDIKYEIQGIGQLLIGGGLQVPIHQREYAWEVEDEVDDLFSDLQKAIDKNLSSYFLSTIVLIRAKLGVFNVVDGQQRLATTSMMLAAIRDILELQNEHSLANSIQLKYLYSTDERTESPTANLLLNLKDRDFFIDAILLSPSEKARKEAWKKVRDTVVPSNAKIAAAATHIRSRFDDLMKSMPASSRKDRLKDWLEFIRYKAQLLILTVEGQANAFKMFETLNARGLKVSEIDLVKNFVFGIADDRLPTVQAKWESMRTMLESLGLEENAIDFLRIVTSVIYGLTYRDAIYRKIEENITSQNAAVQFVTQLDEFASDYVAMLSPDHSKWNDYPQSVRNSLRTLELFNVEQIRYLMLAVSHHFKPLEAAKAFNLFVNWIVRFFIAGSAKIGRVDAIYAKLANEIHTTKNITTAEKLAEEMKTYLANDTAFQAAFAVAHVSKAKLARYYLASIERHNGGESYPELVPNEDTSQVNLEHVIPQNTKAHWKHLNSEVAESLYNRLGNLTLISAKKNTQMGDLGFPDKKKIFATSNFATTKSIAKYSDWGLKQVDERQAELAKIAVKVWPMTVK